MISVAEPLTWELKPFVRWILWLPPHQRFQCAHGYLRGRQTAVTFGDPTWQPLRPLRDLDAVDDDEADTCVTWYSPDDS